MYMLHATYYILPTQELIDHSELFYHHYHLFYFQDCQIEQIMQNVLKKKVLPEKISASILYFHTKVRFLLKI